MSIVERARSSVKNGAAGWTSCLQIPNEFACFRGKDGLSDGAGEYQVSSKKPHATFTQRLSKLVHHYFIADGSPGARFLAPAEAEDPEVHRRFLAARSVVQAAGALHALRETTLGCVSVVMPSGPSELRGLLDAVVLQRTAQRSCGGSRLDGNCEARPNYLHLERNLSRVAGYRDDPKKFARTLVLLATGAWTGPTPWRTGWWNGQRL